jgi:predicted small secreted protein
MAKLLLTFIAGAVLLGSLPACNTMEGLGRDVERGGEKVQKEAQEHKRY